MHIDLSRVRDEPLRWRETREVPASALDREDLAELGPVEWNGEVSWVESGFRFTARLRYRQTLVCTRCLEPFTEPVDAEVELLLVVDETMHEGQGPAGGEAVEVELSERELGVVSLGEERFDSAPILLEQLQLGLPMKPLCRPDCRGLCPRCGADLNQAACSCGRPPADPRWQALAGLRDRLGERE